MIDMKKSFRNYITMLNCDCYIAMLETIKLCAKSLRSFKNLVDKMCLQIIFISIIYL